MTNTEALQIVKESLAKTNDEPRVLAHVFENNYCRHLKKQIDELESNKHEKNLTNNLKCSYIYLGIATVIKVFLSSNRNVSFVNTLLYEVLDTLTIPITITIFFEFINLHKQNITDLSELKKELFEKILILYKDNLLDVDLETYLKNNYLDNKTNS